MAVGSRGRRVGVVVGTEDGSKGLRGSIMEVFGLLADSILAGIGEASLDASLAWSLISYGKMSVLNLAYEVRPSQPSTPSREATRKG